jgi:TolB-like protein
MIVVLIAVVAVGAYRLRAGRPQTRVAVILFDNETGRPEVSRLSQGLTDATVFALTADPKLAVIGNAAVLRTRRPFRDIALVRDALHADFIVVGQVQTVDGRILVRAHLIRAADEVHVWVNAARMEDSEAALQSTVSSRIAAAVASKTQPARQAFFFAVTSTSASCTVSVMAPATSANRTRTCSLPTGTNSYPPR